MGDHPLKLNQAGLDLTRRVLEWATIGDTPGIPLDLDERNIPQRWLRKLDNGWLLGFFNFADEPARVACDEGDLHRLGAVAQAVDIVNSKEIEWSSWACGIDLPAHTSRVFRLFCER